MRRPILAGNWKMHMTIAEATRAGVILPDERGMIAGVMRVADRTATGSSAWVSRVAWRASAPLARMVRIMLFCGACALPDSASRWCRSSG